MPDRIRARALAVALLLVLTAVAIGSLGPRGGHVINATAALPVTLVLELALAAMVIALTWRHTPPTPVALRLNQLLRAALITGLFAVPILYLAYKAKLTPLANHGQVPVLSKPKGRGHPPRPEHGFSWPSVPWRELLILALIIAAVTVVIIARRNRAKLRPADAQNLELEPEPDELARAVESGRAAFSELDDARAAISACYEAMERSLARAGTERGLAETPDELLARAVAARPVPAGPARRLTGLFYEARFSTHHLPPAKRAEAERALADLAAHLPIGRPR
jgi:Domain of unknown function (DUF4129)